MCCKQLVRMLLVIDDNKVLSVAVSTELKITETKQRALL